MSHLGYSFLLPEGWKVTVQDNGEASSSSSSKPDFARSILGDFKKAESVVVATNMNFDASSMAVQILIAGVGKRGNISAETAGPELIDNVKRSRKLLTEPVIKDVELPVGTAKRCKTAWTESFGFLGNSSEIMTTLNVYGLVDGDRHFRFMFMNAGDDDAPEIPTKQILETFRVK